MYHVKPSNESRILSYSPQRYGWHGSEDKFLQKTFDHAIPRYPWLERYRDRAVTELEFLHGHLNYPGDRACMLFLQRQGQENNQYIFGCGILIALLHIYILVSIYMYQVCLFLTHDNCNMLVYFTIKD